MVVTGVWYSAPLNPYARRAIDQSGIRVSPDYVCRGSSTFIHSTCRRSSLVYIFTLIFFYSSHYIDLHATLISFNIITLHQRCAARRRCWSTTVGIAQALTLWLLHVTSSLSLMLCISVLSSAHTHCDVETYESIFYRSVVIRQVAC